MKTGRNDPCPCGSGKKYKSCHAEQTTEQASTNRIAWLVVAVVVVGAISLFASLRGGSGDRGNTPNTPASGVPMTATPFSPATSPPPGDPPAGKVWSSEHGHWHDAADPSQVQMSTTTIPITQGDLMGSSGATPGAPQPAGTAPTGKIWSVEHGHWHDTPTTSSDGTAIPPELQSQMKPPSVPAAPPGAVWSEEHKHWHDAKEEAKRKGTTTPEPPATTTQAPNP